MSQLSRVSVTITPRKYQTELFEASKKKNTVVCLGTGTGKTLVAVMRIKELEHQLKIPFKSDEGKRTVFLVPLVALVEQQARVIEQHTGLSVGRYHGDSGTGDWTEDEWEYEFCKHHVVVMTAEIFRVILTEKFIPLLKINLLVIDECHRAVGHHPYNEIMKFIAEQPLETHPKILGLSAAVVNKKCTPLDLEVHITKLKKTMLCDVKTASDLDNVSKYGTSPKEVIVTYKPHDVISKDYYLEVICHLERVHASLQHIHPDYWENTANIKRKEVIKYVLLLKEVFELMGPWCANECAKILREDLKTAFLYLQHTQFPLLKDFLNTIKTAVEFTGFMCTKIMNEVTSESPVTQFASPHLLKLLAILKAYKPPANSSAQNNSQGDKSRSPLKCGIVFVEKRYVATLLYIWLKEVIDTFPELNFLSPCVIVGHGAGATNHLELRMSVPKQERILQCFRRGYFNLLISTSVVEEGLDVPTCNLVIHFNRPTTFRSYVQSKGRARATDALYFLMVKTTWLPAFQRDLSNFHEIESIIYEKCKVRNENDDHDDISQKNENDDHDDLSQKNENDEEGTDQEDT